MKKTKTRIIALLFVIAIMLSLTTNAFAGSISNYYMAGLSEKLVGTETTGGLYCGVTLNISYNSENVDLNYRCEQTAYPYNYFQPSASNLRTGGVYFITGSSGNCSATLINVDRPTYVSASTGRVPV